MADGTVAFVDGLGLKALDSNEVRRRQISELPKSPQFRSILAEGETQKMNISGAVNQLRVAVPSSSPTAYGEFSPSSSKRASPSRKLQQVFEHALIREAEERAHLQVPIPVPNPKILYNTRGQPYVEGEPNLGYPIVDTRPRRPPQSLEILAQIDRQHSEHQSLCPNPQQHQVATEIHSTRLQTHKPNPNPNAVRIQGKPKPRNWASLLQSQSPSLEMKLDYFPDLQRGKEALVEIDLELTEVGKWNRYLVGHFLDGKMAYPLLVSTARNQWKDLFVAVKSDVAGFYLFEFRDEQAKIQVLEGGPYFFSQKYLVLKDWHRMMKPAKEQPSKIPAWVKFHDLPFELWNQDCLSRVASAVGRPLHVDQATAKTARQPGLLQTKSTKARICIEISAQQDLPDEVTVVVEGESVVVPIEYQVLPPMCNLCHVFGHPTLQCAKKASTSSSHVGNGMQQAILDELKQMGTPLALISTSGSQLESRAVEHIVTHVEALSESEDDILEVQDGTDSILSCVSGAILSTAVNGEGLSTVQTSLNSEGIARVTSLSELQSPPSPVPPDLQGSGEKEKAVMFPNDSTAFNKYLSKSARKRWRKQAREQSSCSLNSGGN